MVDSRPQATGISIMIELAIEGLSSRKDREDSETRWPLAAACT
eukprot:SAG22_NODE_1554_length_4137_cov_3.159485_5_plen_43_part_00